MPNFLEAFLPPEELSKLRKGQQLEASYNVLRQFYDTWGKYKHLSSLTSEDLAQQAWQDVEAEDTQRATRAQRAGDITYAPYSDVEKTTLAKQRFAGLKQSVGELVEDMRSTLEAARKENVHVPAEVYNFTPEQQKLVKENKPYKLTEQQKRARLVAQSSFEELGNALDFNPEEWATYSSDKEAYARKYLPLGDLAERAWDEVQGDSKLQNLETPEQIRQLAAKRFEQMKAEAISQRIGTLEKLGKEYDRLGDMELSGPPMAEPSVLQPVFTAADYTARLLRAPATAVLGKLQAQAETEEPQKAKTHAIPWEALGLAGAGVTPGALREKSFDVAAVAEEYPAAVGGVPVSEIPARLARLSKADWREIVGSLPRAVSRTAEEENPENLAQRYSSAVEKYKVFADKKAREQLAIPSVVEKPTGVEYLAAYHQNLTEMLAADLPAEYPELAQFATDVLVPAAPGLALVAKPAAKLVGKGLKKGVQTADDLLEAFGRQIGGADRAKAIEQLVAENSPLYERVFKTRERGPLEQIARGFTWYPESKDMPEEIGSMMRFIEEIGDTELVQLGREAAPVLADMFKVTAKDPEASRAASAYINALNAGKELPPLSENAQKIVDGNQVLSALHERLRVTEPGIARDVTPGGELVERWRADKLYTPHNLPKELAKPAARVEEPAGVPKFAQEAITPGSAKAREANFAQVPLTAEAWKKEFQEVLPKYTAAKKIRRLTDLAVERNVGVRVTPEDMNIRLAAEFFNLQKPDVARALLAGQEVPHDAKLMVASAKRDMLRKMADEATQRTGIEHVVLGPENLRAQKLLYGIPGEPADIGNLVVARPMAEKISQLTPYLGNLTPDKVAKLDGVMSAAGQFLADVNTGWKIGATVPMPAYHLRNTIGAFMLGTLAHGVKALDPRLQGGAVTGAVLAAVRDPSAMQALDKIPWKTVRGEKTSLGTAVRLAQSTGLLDQFAEGMALNSRIAPTKPFSGALQWLTQGGKLGSLGRADEVVGDILSPAFAARMGENYQRLIGFLGFLEGTKPEDVAKALDLTSKYMGNMRRLGKYERPLNDIVGFYAWQRFVVPHVIRSMWEHPQRMAAFIKWRQAQGDSWSMPLTEHSLPPYMSGAVAAAVKAPEKTLAQIEAGQHAWATIETPFSMGLGLLPAARGLVGGVGHDNEKLGSIFGWLGQLATELSAGVTLRGDKIPGVFTKVGQAAEKTFGRFPSEMVEALRLHAKAKNMADMQRAGAHFASALEGMEMSKDDMLRKRLALGRLDPFGLGRLSASAFGYEDPALGGMFTPTGEVGKFVYPGSERDYTRAQAEAWENAQQQQSFEDLSPLLKALKGK